MNYYHYAKTFRRTKENPLGVDEQITWHFARNPYDEIESVNFIVDEERGKETALVVFRVKSEERDRQVLEGIASADPDTCNHEWLNGKTTGMDGKRRRMKICHKCNKCVLEEEPYGTEAGEMPEAEDMDNKGPGEAGA